MVKSRRKASSGRGAEDVLAGEALLVGVVGDILGAGLAAEGGDLDQGVAAETDVGEAEAAADQEAVAKQLAHLVGGGVGADVEILRRAAEQQVTHPAADQVGLEAVVVQAVEHLEALLVDLPAGDAVFGTA